MEGMTVPKYSDLELFFIGALLLIHKIGCMQQLNEEEFFCKKDGSAHSWYCPAGIAQKVLAETGVIADLNRFGLRLCAPYDPTDEGMTRRT